MRFGRIMTLRLHLLLLVLCLWYRDVCVHAVDSEESYEDELENKLVVDKFVEEIPAPDIVNVNLDFKEAENAVVVNGVVKLMKEIGDEYTFELAIAYANVTETEYRTFFTFPKLDTCVVLRDLYKPLVYDIAKDYSNAPDPDTCPVAKDTFVVKDLPMDTTLLQGLLMTGRYRVDYTIYKDTEIIGKFNLFFRIEKINS